MLRKLSRVTFNVLAALSLGLCVAAWVLWVQSYFGPEREYLIGRVGVVVGAGRLEYWTFDDATAGRFRGFQPDEEDGWPIPVVESLPYYAGFRRMQDWRFSGASGVAMPTWFPFAVSTIPVLWRYRRALLRRLPIPREPAPPGVCARCGYDLRATPGRCPECGTAVQST